MASFVAVKLLPASSCFVVQRPGLGFGQARHSSMARFVLPDLRLRLPSVRCSAEEGKTDAAEKPEVAKKRGVSLEKPEEGYWDTRDGIKAALDRLITITDMCDRPPRVKTRRHVVCSSKVDIASMSSKNVDFALKAIAAKKESHCRVDVSWDENGAVEKVVDVISVTVSQLLEHLHHVSKHLEFWQKLAKGGRSNKLSFMMLERGPWAFFQRISKFIRASVVGPELCHAPGKKLLAAASSRISERVAVLVDLHERRAKITGQVHIEVDKMGEKVSGEQNSRLASSECILAVLKALSILEGWYELPQRDYYKQGDLSAAVTLVLDFDDIPEILGRRIEWTNSDLDHAIKLLSDSLWKLHFFLDTLMWEYRRLRTVVRKWIHTRRNPCFSGGALGLGILSGWLFHHSQLGGSNDLERWTKEGVGAAHGFLEEHVQKPLLSIRGDLFDTFRKRHREGSDLGDVKVAAESQHMMLQEFVAQTEGSDTAESSSEQHLMELMMSIYETELNHPLRNFLVGELTRALLIQVQKLKLDIETCGQLVSITPGYYSMVFEAVVSLKEPYGSSNASIASYIEMVLSRCGKDALVIEVHVLRPMRLQFLLSLKLSEFVGQTV